MKKTETPIIKEVLDDMNLKPSLSFIRFKIKASQIISNDLPDHEIICVFLERNTYRNEKHLSGKINRYINELIQELASIVGLSALNLGENKGDFKEVKDQVTKCLEKVIALAHEYEDVRYMYHGTIL